MPSMRERIVSHNPDALFYLGRPNYDNCIIGMTADDNPVAIYSYELLFALMRHDGPPGEPDYASDLELEGYLAANYIRSGRRENEPIVVKTEPVMLHDSEF